jgi:hypothetical protein
MDAMAIRPTCRRQRVDVRRRRRSCRDAPSVLKVVCGRHVPLGNRPVLDGRRTGRTSAVWRAAWAFLFCRELLAAAGRRGRNSAATSECTTPACRDSPDVYRGCTELCIPRPYRSVRPPNGRRRAAACSTRRTWRRGSPRWYSSARASPSCATSTRSPATSMTYSFSRRRWRHRRPGASRSSKWAPASFRLCRRAERLDWVWLRFCYSR